MPIGAVNNQPVNAVQDTPQPKEITSNSSGLTSKENGQLIQGLAGIISMQAISTFNELGSLANEAITKPSILAQENKKAEKEEENKREADDH